MPKLTASVVGGGAGGGLSLAALQAPDRFDLKAACDLKPDVCETLREKYTGIQTYTSHREMFDDCPTDVVCVSTYATSHLPIALDALALPLKGILVEKPLGNTWDVGNEVLESVRSKGIPMAVPHGLLAMDHSLQIIDLVQRGAIGNLQFVNVECAKWDIINAGIHWFNFFIHLTGFEAIESVLCQCDASTRTYRDGMQVETVAATSVQTASGIRMLLTSGDDVKNLDGADIVWHVYGNRGTIKFWAFSSEYEIFNADHPTGKRVEVPANSISGHQRHLENMADQIEAGRLDYSIAESSLTALEMCEAAYVSSRNGCLVTFPLTGFTAPPASDWIPGEAYSGAGGGRDGRKL